MKIDILVAPNPYNSTQVFAQGLSDGLRAIGISTRIVDIEPAKIVKIFNDIQTNKPDLTCSFSDVTYHRKPICEHFNRPHLSLFVDPAIYFLHQLQAKQSWVSYVDQHDQQLLNGMNFTQHFFLPHAGDPKMLQSPSSARHYQAVFFGSCIDYNVLSQTWLGKYPKAICDVLQKTCDKVLSQRMDSILYVLLETLVENGFTPQEHNLAIYHHEIDQYIRGKDRVELLKSLHHLKIDLFGNTEKLWQKYLVNCPHISIHAAISFEDSIKIMKNAKIVINSSARFKAGSHERLFYAALAGALVITNETLFTQQFFPEESFLTYQPGVYKVKDASLATMQEMVERCQQHVLEQHTWQKRAETIVSHFL